MSSHDDHLLHPHLMTLQEAAQFLNVSKITLRRWTRNGLLTCVRFGQRKDRRFRMEDLQDFVRRNTEGADGKGKSRTIQAVHKPVGESSRESLPHLGL